MHKLRLDQKEILVNLLLECPSIKDGRTRHAFLQELPFSVAEDASQRVHVLNIINACMNQPDGLDVLLTTLRFFDGETIPFKNFSWVAGNIAGHGEQKHLSELMDKKRKEPEYQQAGNTRIDKSFFIDYNLDKQVQIFMDALDAGSCNELGYEGVFAFSLNGYVLTLEGYIIERMLRELKKKTKHEYTKHSVWLTTDNMHSMDQAIITQLGIDNFKELAEDADNVGTDVVLTVWNTHIPAKNFFVQAADVQQRIKQDLSGSLGNPSRCFIVIWANENLQQAENQGFIDLPVPQKFNLKNLLRWISVELREKKVNEESIHKLTNKVRHFKGDINHTYRLLKSALQLLRG